MKKSSPSSVSLAKSSNIWKRWEIFPISTLPASQCCYLPQPRNHPPALERKMPLCLYSLPRMQTKPPLLPVTADPSLCLIAGCWCTREPGEHCLQNRRWRSERRLRVHQGVCHCTNTHLPRTHHGRCKSDLRRNAKMLIELTWLCWLH